MRERSLLHSQARLEHPLVQVPASVLRPERFWKLLQVGTACDDLCPSATVGNGRAVLAVRMSLRPDLPMQ
jgi:hypothetical protein